MYLIGIKNGVHPMGNFGTLITNYKSNRKIREVAQQFARMYMHDEVYAIGSYTQKMCEMSNGEFVNYVRSNGRKLI